MDNVAAFFLVFGLSNSSPLLDSQMIFGAEHLIFFTFAMMAITAILGHGKEKKALFFSLMGILITLAAIKLIRFFIQEPRPFITYPAIKPLIDATGLSFPSVHTAIMTVIATSYTVYKSKTAVIFILALLWVGIARIYTGVHYPFDILGGVLTGVLSVIFLWQIRKRIKLDFLDNKK